MILPGPECSNPEKVGFVLADWPNINRGHSRCCRRAQRCASSASSLAWRSVNRPPLLFLHHTESVSAGEATEATGRELSRRLQVRPRLVLFGPIPVLSQSGFAQEGAVCPMRCRTFVENRDQGAASFRIRTVNRRSIVVVAQKPRSSAFTRTALPSR